MGCSKRKLSLNHIEPIRAFIGSLPLCSSYRFSVPVSISVFDTVSFTGWIRFRIAETTFCSDVDPFKKESLSQTFYGFWITQIFFILDSGLTALWDW